ncbi:hypothetical protein H9P43_008905 [Blastocladiella emersonii ATCC 22665]|nr:hypothetical protein H9P43_008905 [Blastocladiella emersonii ATCC 22665]
MAAKSSGGQTTNLATALSTPAPTPRQVTTFITDLAAKSRAADYCVGSSLALITSESASTSFGATDTCDPRALCETAKAAAAKSIQDGANADPIVAPASTTSSVACAVAAKAWLAMHREQRDQVIHVHGLASTQHTGLHQLILEQLMRQSAATGKATHRLHTDLAKAHLLMDCMGAATSPLGATSVRYGKLTEVQFDALGTIVGAKICDYHFDNARAGNPPLAESNFHALHAICAAAATAPELKAMKLVADQTKYNLLCNGARVAAKNVSAATYRMMTKCMKALGLKKRFQQSFFSVLAGLLHLGNLEFEMDSRNKQAAAYVRNVDVLETAAALLGLPAERLQSVVTCKTTVSGDSAYTDFLNPVQAREVCGNFISAVYGSMFSYLLDLVNRKLSSEATTVHTINVVDMGGVEAQYTNAAHQLCRNYAAERMHQFYLKHVAQTVRTATGNADAAAAIDALVQAGPAGLMEEIFDLLERETRNIAAASAAAGSPTTPTARAAAVSSLHLLDKLHSQYAHHPSYSLPPTDSASGFAVRHSTGIVTYSITTALQQLSSIVPAEFITACRSDANKNPVLKQAFNEARFVTYVNPKRAKTIVAGRAANLRRNPTKMVRRNTGGIKRDMATAAVAAGPAAVPSPASPTLAEVPPAVPETVNEDDEDENDTDVPLSRLSNTVVGQHRVIMDKLLATLDASRVWTVALVPTSGLSDDVVRQLGIPTLIGAARTAPYAAVVPVATFLAAYPKVSAGLASTSANPMTLVAHLRDTLAIQPAVSDAGDLVLLRDAEWLVLEGAETAGALQETAHGLVTFAKVQDRAQREEAAAGEAGAESEDDRSSIAGTVVTQDDFELGELGPDAADAAAGGGGGAGPAHAAKAKAADPPKKPKLSKIRRRWLCATTCLTFWIPERALVWRGMARDDVRQTWREKVALCTIIAILSALMLFFITGFSKLMCPEVDMYTLEEVFKEQREGSSKWTRHIINGYIYDSTSWSHPNTDGYNQQAFLELHGRDASAYFPRWNPSTGEAPSVCAPRTARRQVDGADQQSQLSRRGIDMDPKLCVPTGSNATGYCHSYSQMAFKVAIKDPTLTVSRVAKIAWTLDAVAARNSDTSRFVVIDNNVYDVTLLTSGKSPLTDAERTLLLANGGKDITAYGKKYVNMKCLDAVAWVGVVDNRNYLVCQISTYILMGVTYVMVAIMVIKFLSALQLGSKRMPEDIDKYVIMQVPCYSEGTDSLKKTIDSLALTTYDDTRKLLFVVADGMVKGSGNDKPTPDLVLDILGVPDTHRDVSGFSYHAIGEGSKGHNKGKIYSGLYHVQGRAVPYIVVIKCGTEQETTKAGNRGKRDSQMVLMKWLNKVHLNLPMTPLELEMYRHVRNVIGVQPALYEYILMVDADTEVGPDSLTRLVSACVNDGKIMGLCGLTKIANEKQSWITMIQVYEYWISHHLAKAFESLFGTVTCLPGCFSMYRLYSQRGGKKTLLLIDSEIIDLYAESVVDTLHKKNLLSLGEDRYLTTLMLKKFNQWSQKFIPDAYCLTIVPDSFSVLLSQRRRWINSTIHNLFELSAVSDLCGCLIFSMRLVIITDLVATLVMPASVGYLGYLIYLVIMDSKAHMQVLILIAATYGMQAVIFLIKRQFQHIGWMLVHILAMPVFYMYIPLYSFWHFDDFSWGATRRIEGDSGKGGHDGDNELFDPSTIPTAKWDDYKRVKRTEASLDATKASMDNLAAASGDLGTLKKSVKTRGGSTDNLRSAAGIDGHGSTAALHMNSSSANLLRGAHSASVASLTDMYRTNVYADGGGNMVPMSAMSAAPGGYMYPAVPHGTPMSATGMPMSAMGGMGMGMGGFGYSPSMANLFSPQLASGMPPPGGQTLGRGAGAGGAVSDQMILDQVRVLLAQSDLALVTKKSVRTSLSNYFGVDLAPRRDWINSCVDMVLLEMQR